jgi:hypothetical protein
MNACGRRLLCEPNRRTGYPVNGGLAVFAPADAH